MYQVTARERFGELGFVSGRRRERFGKLGLVTVSNSRSLPNRFEVIEVGGSTPPNAAGLTHLQGTGTKFSQA